MIVAPDQYYSSQMFFWDVAFSDPFPEFMLFFSSAVKNLPCLGIIHTCWGTCFGCLRMLGTRSTDLALSYLNGHENYLHTESPWILVQSLNRSIDLSSRKDERGGNDCSELYVQV